MRLLPVQVNRFNRARKTGSKGKNVGRFKYVAHGSTWRLHSSRTAEASVGRVCYHDCFFLRDPR